MAAICSKGGPTSPLKTMAESVATLARCPRGTSSSVEKEQQEELGRAESTPDSRFRAAARISARSAMDETEASAGRTASRRAQRRDAVTGVEEERGRLVYATVGGGIVETGVVTTTATAEAGEAGEVGWATGATSGGSGATSSRVSPDASPAGGAPERALRGVGYHRHHL